MTEENLSSRLARVQAAVQCEKGDRLPVIMAMDYKFPCRYKGITQGEYFRNRALGTQALLEVFDEFGGWDVAGGGGMTTRTRDMLEAPMVIKVPGKDIGEEEVIQWDEKEILTLDDYDRIAEMGWKAFIQDFYPRFRGWDVDDYKTRIEARADKQLAGMKAGQRFWADKGYPVWGGASPFSPLMMLSCSRSMTPFTMDLHRIPDKVEAVMEAMIDDLIEVTIESVKSVGITSDIGMPSATIILERGGNGYYPLKIFERFEFPYLKKMVEALVAEDITPIMHFDQDWTLNLPYLKELPPKKCIMQLDSVTDIFKAKEILKDHICIMGDVPPALLTLGKPGEVEDYCKKLMDVIGEDGGFILGVACGVPVDSKFDNLKAMIDTARNYRPSHW